MILSIAWRNIWRNKVRSLVVILSMTTGVFAGVFSAALFKGMMVDRINTGIETEISHIQVHHPGYLANNDLQHLIQNADSIESGLRLSGWISQLVSRVLVNGMVTSAETGAGIRLVGIDPAAERTVTNLHKKISEGSYFTGNEKNPIIVSKKTADKLKVKLKSKIILTFQNLQGDIVQAAYRVAGIYKTENSAFDESNAFVLKHQLVSLTEIPDNSVHEIAITISDPEDTDEITAMIAGKLKNMDVQSWKQLYPDFGYMVAMMDQMMYIFVLIILMALGFGIVNTMMMVVLERVRELGMLMAVGMGKIKIFLMIMLETVLLSCTGGLAGILAGILVSKHFETHGISFTQYTEAFNQFGYSSVFHTRIEPEMVVIISFLVLITGILAAIYPARKALKLNPCDALRNR